VSQALYGIALGARTARALLDRAPSEAIAPMDYVVSLAQGGLADMRALIFELRPESLEVEGLCAGLHRQADSLRARHSVEVHVDLCEEPQLALDVKEALYRTAQEALHNAAKHARADRVELRLRSNSAFVQLEVCDNGIGFDPSGSFPGHLGLVSMRERAANVGGTLEIVSTPKQGTCICARVPAASTRE
jgi:signal transduction histidine kinase